MPSTMGARRLCRHSPHIPTPVAVFDPAVRRAQQGAIVSYDKLSRLQGRDGALPWCGCMYQAHARSGMRVRRPTAPTRSA